MKSMVEKLIPFMKDIKSAMNYQEANLTSFKELLHQLTAHNEEHKNQTAAELAQLQTFLNTTQSILDNLTHYIEQLAVYHICGCTKGW